MELVARLDHTPKRRRSLHAVSLLAQISPLLCAFALLWRHRRLRHSAGLDNIATHNALNEDAIYNLKPGTGTKDAPRAFSLKLRKTSRAIGLLPFAYDQEFEKMDGLLTAKHVDDINMAGLEK